MVGTPLYPKGVDMCIQLTFHPLKCPDVERIIRHNFEEGECEYKTPCPQDVVDKSISDISSPARGLVGIENDCEDRQSDLTQLYLCPASGNQSFLFYHIFPQCLKNISVVSPP